ncbi:carbohydrate sulfotransferase 9-like isoform X3 [Mercenaria mercenaria]|uniref:carbohydrate sulfotransferase 9-like isoform X3 n=1 Tax=Mercenaria mercenaria TaxID=6596 RepID=UPI00234EBBA8|nr:carbohydrate sulfotransferase 9-like isoform X3 [Mercenaria mercenaria]
MDKIWNNAFFYKTNRIITTLLSVNGLIIFCFIFYFKDTVTYNEHIARESLKGHLLKKDKLFNDETREVQKQQTVSEGAKSNYSKKHLLSTTSTKHMSSASLVYLANVRKFKKKEQEMKERLSRVRQKCLDYMQNPYWQNLRQGGRVWTYEPQQIHYCIIPKVGCTFWKRIMRFLGKDYPRTQNVQRPSDIDRGFVHYGGLSNLQQWSVQNPIAHMLMTNGNSFMMTRDPYSRLWSAYIDKFLLPDFWRTDAKAVVKKLRPNATEYERNCANNVSFYEYLLFINRTYKSGLNEHWDKMHRLCSPCHVQYDVIGKQESFSSDADYILTKFNIDYLKENTTKLDMVHEEVTTLTKYNFNLESAITEGCFEKLDVAKRLWLAFQYNGYIDRNADFPEKYLMKTGFLIEPAEIFMDLVFQTIKNQTDQGIDIKGQKRTMMLEAYRKIPDDLLKAIVNVYEYDFELFGYNRTLLL